MNILNQKTDNGVKVREWMLSCIILIIKDFQVVPQECTEYLAKYVKSTQYKVDSQRQPFPKNTLYAL